VTLCWSFAIEKAVSFSGRGVTFDMLLAKGEPRIVPVAANRFTCVVARYGNSKAGQMLMKMWG